MSEMSINDIKNYLPHRYPFLLVDRVLSWQANESIKAIKNVTHNEPFFMGHFPVQPVMPGVLMIEALAQTAGILMAKSLQWPEHHDNLFFLAGVDKARFKRIVEPGDVLQLDVTVSRQRRDAWKFVAQASVAGVLAVNAEIMAIRGNQGD